MNLPDSYIARRRWLNKYYLRNIFIPFLLAIGLVIRASFFQRRRDPSAFTEIDFFTVVEIFIVIMAMPYILSKKGVRASQLLIKSPIKYYFYYCLWCLVSTIWSSDVIYSVFRLVELLTVLFLFAYIFIDIRKREVAKKVLLTFIFISLVSGLGYHFKNGSFSFDAFHSNAYPMISAAGVLIGFYVYQDRRYFDYDYLNIGLLSGLLLIISIIGIIMGTSGASNLSLFVALLLLFSLRKNRIITFSLLVISFLFILFLWENYQEQFIKIIFPGKPIEMIESGTGRTNMWKYYIEGFKERPIFGYGFPTGEKEGFKFGWITTSSSHNMLISVAINTGIIGLILFITFIIKYTLYLIKKLNEGYLDFKWITGAWIVFVVNSMSLPALGSHWTWITSSVFCIMGYSVINYRQP